MFECPKGSKNESTNLRICESGLALTLGGWAGFVYSSIRLFVYSSIRLFVYSHVTKGESLSAGVAGRVGRVVLEPNPQVGKSFPWIRQRVRLATRGKYNNHPRDILREPGPR